MNHKAKSRLQLRYPLLTSALVTTLGLSHSAQAETFNVASDQALRDAINAARPG